MTIKQSFSLHLNEKTEKLLHSSTPQLKIEKAKSLILEHCSFDFSIDNLNHISEISSYIKNKFKLAIIISVGGSLSSGKSYAAIKNYCSKDFKLLYIDSFNHKKFEETYTKERLEISAIIVISKSGNSVETLHQTDLAINKYKEYFGEDYNLGKHFFFITSDKKLSQKASLIKAKIYDYTSKGGKFSSFSLPSLLPASLVNLDPKEILNGACNVLRSPQSSAMAAFVQYFLMSDNYNISVMSFYNNFLEQMLIRYMQISGEISAKQEKGFSCIVSNGILDQHGLWQLFLSGPKDKYFTFIINTSDEKSDNFAKFLGKTYHQLNIVRLKKRKMHYRMLKIKELDACNMGAISMHFLMELMILADLMNISPIDQKEIEESKLFLSDLFSKNYYKTKSIED